MARKVTTIARVAAGACALTVLGGPLVAVGDSKAASQRELRRARHTNVYVQGDSLTVGTAGPLRRTLDPHVGRLSIDAAIGRHTATGLSRLGRDRRARLARVWIVALGTNDAPSPVTVGKQVRQSLRLAGPRRDVVWLTLQRPGGYGPVNSVLRDLDRRHERLHVIDWARLVSSRPGLLAPDRVHATIDGYRARADLMARAAVILARASD